LSHSTLADEFQTILSIKVSQQVVLPILDVPIFSHARSMTTVRLSLLNSP
jgi:hypothetical protein